MTLRASGAVEPSSAVKDVTMTFLKRASTYQTAFKAVAAGKSRPCKISADLALNIIISGNLMRKTYEMKRSKTNSNHGVSVYPRYDKIVTAKKRYYPSDITVTETSTEVKLQSSFRSHFQ
ncbi:hypothetical protein ILUMI_17498 [Ignelater luminosus]|uniref:Uncharacterized protein n=1 Tax=Ignelater luminosus TaxID=2038154 RepID=A0A8K0G1U0_IGNLU|nr:hypothetical protein ILUMI_17498 [Ignelater luminosus]